MKRKTRSQGVKLLSVSFWMVIVIHLVVFTAVGLFTPHGWQMLIIFVVGAPVMIVIKRLAVRYFTRSKSGE